MRDGISLRSDYESTTWTRCSTRGTTLAPTTGAGVYFGPAIQSTTLLDGFIVARFAATTTAAVTIDGARGSVVTDTDVGSAAIGATTAIGVDVKNGAEARLNVHAAVQTLEPSGYWSPLHQFGIRAKDSKIDVQAADLRLLVSPAWGQGQDGYGIWLENAGGSSVTATTLTLYGGATVVGLHAQGSAGLILDGTAISLTSDGLEEPNGAVGAELIGSPDLAYASGNISISASTVQQALRLESSPGAHVTATIYASGQQGIGSGALITGDATATVLAGSVTTAQATTAGAIGVEDCSGSAPEIRASVDARATAELTDGLRVSGNCQPTITSAITLRAVLATHVTLNGIHCVGASRCAIDGANVQIIGGTTMPGTVLTATGVMCDAGSCVSIRNSTIRGLSQTWELRNTLYYGGGIVAPGATTISGNVVDAGCSGGNGAGIRGSGRIENNVITGPTCGGASVGSPQALGLEVTGNADVHSNTIASGGALDGLLFGQSGCRSAGITLTSGTASFRNNIVIASTCTPTYAFVRAETLGQPVPAPIALDHNALVGAYLDGATVLTTDQVNALPYATGNFSSDCAQNSAGVLPPGSPCIDAGTTSGAPAADFQGDARDLAPDVGADEWTGAASVCRGVTCSNHGVCLAADGSPACHCDPDYIGADCSSPNPCTIGNGGCDALASCSALPDGGHTCGGCPPGYDGSGDTACVDIDECSVGSDDCHAPASCVNLPGSFDCQCPTGYVYDLGQCVDIDECQQQNGGCDPVSRCTNEPGGRSCGPCAAGFTGSGDTGCFDIDECLQNHGGCDPLVLCLNSPGGRECGPCPLGYAGTGDTECTKTCSPGHMGAECDVVFTRLSAKEVQNCGLRTDGRVRCWGDNSLGQSAPPEGTYVAVSVGHKHSCAVKSDGSIECWGYGYFGLPPGTGYVDVATSYDHSCGIEASGNVVCWGDTSGGKATPPLEALESVVVGAWHSCGIRVATGTVACWGLDDGFNDYGQADPPSGSFTTLDSYLATTCGIDATGRLACWGQDLFAGVTLPSGSFNRLSIGPNFGCAIRTDGALACWGENGFGQATPPTGTFDDVALGDAHACALRNDGQVLCWGRETSGDTLPPTGGG